MSKKVECPECKYKFEIADESHQPKGLGSRELKEVLRQNFQKIEELSRDRKFEPGISSGFPELDKLLGGWKPGHLIAVAGRPGVGKTSFLLNLAKNAALDSKKSVIYFTLEMAAPELSMRILSIDAKVDRENLVKGKLNENEWKNLTYSAARLSNAPIFIEDRGGIRISQIIDECEKRKTISGLDLVIVDYLQLVAGEKDFENSSNRVEEISKISLGLKVLAKKFKVPVIVSSQLNRGVEVREDKRPRLSDLRDSSALEADSDIAILLYREGLYGDGNLEDSSVAEVIVGKHRAGKTGTIKLSWQGSYTSFENPES